MKRLITILVLLAATSAWGATRYVPAKFAPGNPGDDADSVHVFVISTTGPIDSLKLTANTDHSAIFWEGGFDLEKDSIYHFLFQAWYDGETDSILVMGDHFTVEDPADYANAVLDENLSGVGNESHTNLTLRNTLGSMFHMAGIFTTQDSSTNTTTRFRVSHGTSHSYANASLVGHVAIFADTTVGDWTLIGGQARRIIAFEGDYSEFHTFMTIDRPLRADSASEASGDFLPGAGLNFIVMMAATDSLFEGSAAGGGSSPWTAAGVDSVISWVDTALTHGPHSNDFGGLGAGTGNWPCTLHVNQIAVPTGIGDTTSLMGAVIRIYETDSSTGVGIAAPTGSNGLAVYNLGSTDPDNFLITPYYSGFTPDSVYQEISVTSSGGYFEIWLTEIATPTGDSADMCMLYGYVKNAFGVRLPNVTVEVMLYQEGLGRLGDNVFIMGGSDYWTTDATGYFEGYIERSDSVSYSSGDAMQVEFKVNGVKIDKQFTIPDTTAYALPVLVVPDP